MTTTMLEITAAKSVQQELRGSRGYADKQVEGKTRHQSKVSSRSRGAEVIKRQLTQTDSPLSMGKCGLRVRFLAGWYGGSMGPPDS